MQGQQGTTLVALHSTACVLYTLLVDTVIVDSITDGQARVLDLPQGCFLTTS
jgi:hypothetical protein